MTSRRTAIRQFARSAPVLPPLEDGQITRELRVDLVRGPLVNFAKTLSLDDEVVIEATGNSAAVEPLMRPYVKRVVVANSRLVRAIAYTRAKTDSQPRKVRSGTPLVCAKAGTVTPSTSTERSRRRPRMWSPAAAKQLGAVLPQRSIGCNVPVHQLDVRISVYDARHPEEPGTVVTLLVGGCLDILCNNVARSPVGRLVKSADMARGYLT